MVTRKAHADLVAIGQFTAQEWGIARRNKYLKQLDNCFLQISKNPESGFACDFIANGYRKFPIASHLIFYKQNSEGIIEIIRVLHQMMDVESKF